MARLDLRNTAPVLDPTGKKDECVRDISVNIMPAGQSLRFAPPGRCYELMKTSRSGLIWSA